MPVKCKVIGGKHRIVGPDGKIEKTADGNPRDDGGHDTAEGCQGQANAINASVHNEDDERDLTRYATRAPVGKIDREKGIIYGISVITKGEAKGHGEYVDETMLDQVNLAGQEKEPVGTKCRFDHPNACSRAIGSFVGRLHEFRRDGDNDRADLHIADVAAKSPEGDLRDYVLSLAEEDPDAFATSIVFRRDKPMIVDKDEEATEAHPDDNDPFWFPHVRLAKLKNCDVVDSGAANEGIFGRPDYFAEQAEAWAREHPNVVGKIIAVYYERKKRKETEEMDKNEEKELRAELATAVETIETGTTKLTEATTMIESMTAETETKITEAKTEAKAAMLAIVAERVEKYGDPKFVIDTIELSDEEVKDKYIEVLKKGNGDGVDGVDAAEFSAGTGGTGGAGDGEATFEAKVDEKVAAGKKRGEAISLCVGEFPKLHKKYLARINKERKPSDDEDD